MTEIKSQLAFPWEYLQIVTPESQHLNERKKYQMRKGLMLSTRDLPGQQPTVNREPVVSWSTTDTEQHGLLLKMLWIFNKRFRYAMKLNHSTCLLLNFCDDEGIF